MFRPLKLVLTPGSRLLFFLLAAAILGLWSLGLGILSLTDSTVSSTIRFQDVAISAGLDFVLRNDAAERKYQVETILGGVGVIDFDNDGWPDLFAANGASLPRLEKNHRRFYNRLYRNNRNGTFTDVTDKSGVAGRGYSMGVAVGDFNNDGWEDLYVVGVNENILYRNNGNGSFTDITQTAGVEGRNPSGKKFWSVAAAWLDYDNDGRLDLLVSNYCDWSPGNDPVCGGLAGQSRTYCSPDSYRGQPCVLYHNNSDGTFTDVSLVSGIGRGLAKGMGIAISDYDDDGYADVFVANDNSRNLLFHNRGDGRFEEVGISAGVAYNGDGRQISGMGADFRDYDGDGRPDIIMTGLQRETFELFRNLGNHQFADFSAQSGILRLSQPWSGWSCGFVDLDNDGCLDFFVANGGLDVDAPQPNRVFRNLGDRRFVDVSIHAGPDLQVRRLHRGAAFADFDNDGRIDTVVTALNEPLELLMNRSLRQHWLELKLRGRTSNRSALGAHIVCQSPSRRQVTWVSNSVGYASASDLRVHLGLGEDRLANRVEIRWPSRIVQVLTSLPCDQILEVMEPASEKEK
jgi:hypothetical protein